jgi:hypothetical protein
MCQPVVDSSQESFLFRSRTHGQKLSYKNIATRLDKTELACRLHYHHMTVGRKAGGPRDEEDFEDDIVSSDGSSISAVPPMLPPGHLSPPVAYRQSPRAVLASTATTAKPVLPSFETFCREANALHHRSISLPVPVFDIATSSTQLSYTANKTRRTYSGTYLRDQQHNNHHVRPWPEAPTSSATSRSGLTTLSTSSYTTETAARSPSYTKSHTGHRDRF